MGGARKGIGWCLGDAGEGILVIAALFFVLSGIKCHKYQIIACLMFGTSLVPSGQLLLLLEGPTADYGIQGFSMPDRVLP